MVKKPKSPPKIAQRHCVNGYVYTYDDAGRLCLDVENRERIVLLFDLRTYGEGLHVGALGWTIPETSDGYTFADVLFDTGQKLRLKQYSFERVTLESANAVAQQFVEQNLNTRFDADPLVAATCRKAWISKYYSEYLTLSETIVKGVGDQELYAFTFPTLMELATLKGDELYPVKVGFSKDLTAGAFGRIRSQIFEKAGFPEKPIVLLVFKTWDGQHLEKQIHRRLRLLGRRATGSLGREWFKTSTAELLRIIDECDLAVLPPDRLITGARETIEEGFTGLMENGATIEMRMIPGEAAFSIRIRNKEDESEKRDKPEQKRRSSLD